jgi:competence protein ComEC
MRISLTIRPDKALLVRISNRGETRVEKRKATEYGRNSTPIMLVVALILLVAGGVVGYVFLRAPEKAGFAAPASETPVSDAGRAVPPMGKLEVSFMDVVRSGQYSMLIDEGGNGGAPKLVEAIKDMGIRSFDTVIGTHPDADHVGGLDSVVDAFDIGRIYMPDVLGNTRTFEDAIDAIARKGDALIHPVPGTRFKVGGAECEIIAPNGGRYSEENDYSIVVRVAFGSTSFLFEGDAEEGSEREMLEKGYTLKSDVLKVAHHGSDKSTTEGFLEAVSPAFAVISVGANNQYGHPGAVTMDRLKSSGAVVYRTDENGTVTFVSDGSKLKVTTER